MCHGNLAEASASYINAQLNALWANSKVCSDKEGLGRVPRDDVVKRGVAFREFFGPESQAGNSVVLHAVFNAPQVEFICDHELVLTLDIKEGQYNVETSSATFANTKLAVRLSYRVQDIIAPLVGGNTVISVLNIDSASGSIVFGRSTSESKVDMGTLFQVVKTYYFPTIFSGLLNLFVLPASYTNKQSIDHGVLVKGIMPRDLLFGIDVAKINAILSGRWLAAIYAAKSNSSKNSDTFLSHYQPQWEINGSALYSNIQLQAMRIQVLCDQEVVLFVKGDINFYRDQALQVGSAALKGWELAIIFSVVYRDGRILLTQSRAPRIIDTLCTMPGGFVGVDKLQAQFRSIILGRYCQLIFQYKHEQLYPDFPPPHPHGSEGPKPIPCPKPDPTKWPLPCPRPHPDGPYCPGGKVDINWDLLWRQFIPETSLHKYHRITTVTQAGLNAHFAAIWQKAQAVIASTSTTTFTEVEQRLAILGHFDSKQAGATVGTDGLPHFVADFGVPQVEFLTHSNSKSVIVYFNVKKIVFETSDKVTHEYKDWLLAFQFDLQLLSKDLTKEGSITAGTGLAGYRQLTLNSSTATFLHDRSTFADLLNDKESQVLRALYPYLQDAFTQRYISAFVQKGQNILYTLPIHSQQHLQNKPDTHGRAHAMTDVDFTIVPFSLDYFKGEVFQGIGGPAHHIVERNMIVFHGVFGDKSPNTRLPPGPYGAPSIDPPHGTLLLAKDVFLDSQLLKPLAEVNALSTILCQLVGVSKDGDWNLELRSWKNHPSKSSDDCIWVLDPTWKETDDSMPYQWKTEEEWKYESEGMGTRDATYTLETKTTNTLEIPTANVRTPDVPNPLVINISGVTHVHMTCDATREDEHWKGGFVAKWTAPITLASDAKDGVYVQTLEETVTLDFEDDRSLGLHPKGVAALDAAKAKYREVFGQNPINTTSILDGINKSFKGVFQGLMMPITSLVLSKPIFNSNGDLLLHLIPQGTGSATAGTTTTPVPQPVSTSTKQAGLIQKTAEESGSFLAGLFASKPAAPSISLPTLAIPSNPSPTSSISQTLTNNTPFPPDSAPASADKSADGYFSAIDAAKTIIPVAVDASNVSPTGVVSEKPPVQQDIQTSELQPNQVWNA